MDEQSRQKLIVQALKYHDFRHRVYSLKSVFAEPHTKSEVAILLDAAQVALPEQNLAVLVVRWDMLHVSMADAQQREAARDKLLEQLTDKVFSGVHFVAFENAADELVLFCNMNIEQQIGITSRMEQLCISLEMEREMQMFVGISCIENGYENLYSLFLQAKKASKSLFVLANCKVMIYTDNDNLSQYFDSNELMINLRRGDMEMIRQYIESIFNGMAQQRATKEACIFVSLMLLSVLNKYLLENSQNLEYDTNGLIDAVSNKQTLMELKAFVLMMFAKSLESLPENRIMHEKVIQTKQYIEEHYFNQDLSLNTVAGALFINSSYLCTLFKKETNMTIVEYIKDYRLELSKQMFNDKPSMTVTEVANAVGYADEYYFMRCFKKKYGISPKNYKRMQHTDGKE